MICFLIVFSLQFVGTSFAVTGNNFRIEDHLKYKNAFSYHEGKSEKLVLHSLMGMIPHVSETNSKFVYLGRIVTEPKR